MSEHKRSPIQRQRTRNVSTRYAVAALFCILLAATTGCGSTETPTPDGAESPAASDVQEYALRGKVVQLEPENQAATIEHEEITGWMDAMTMRFPIKDRADYDKLAVGAEIEATVFVSSDGFQVGNVKVVSSGNGDQGP
jgi:Cu/Ag efflux protein CusF